MVGSSSEHLSHPASFHLKYTACSIGSGKGGQGSLIPRLAFYPTSRSKSAQNDACLGGVALLCMRDLPNYHLFRSASMRSTEQDTSSNPVYAGKHHRCQDCGKTYKAYESLCRHRKVHRKGAVFSCKTCNAHFLRKDILHRHEKIHQRSATNGLEQDRGGRGDRLRASKSCDHCSKRKVRCTGGDAFSNGPCSQCQVAGIICTYLRRSTRASVSLAGQIAQQDELQVAEDSQDQGIEPINFTPSALAEQELHTKGPPPLDADRFDIVGALCNFANIVTDRTDVAASTETYGVPSLAGPSLTTEGRHGSNLSPTDNWQSDGLNTQCWDWILDEFIPSSPQMMSSRASPALFRSTQAVDGPDPRANASIAQNSDFTTSSTADWELRQSCVFLVVNSCTNSFSHAEENTETLMRKEGERVASIFPIVHPPETCLFDWLLDLFFQHFHPLWPTFPPGYFDKSTCPPELFLTLAIIGAHYGGEDARLFGR